ncbi:DegT/DnrJ/EryC1/StrS family aminotransferase (plasmid) [Bartonella sp. HY329]|uniref:DegT/DnrJ/EryC1/StrS family aminotransferase n=1 Tax=unclassified Bartonella TaxID=2645622 RepID=UPI0021C8822F|nr:MULTISPECIES: DegT/DnrJ/EryC1/StrS family aminotransferase [unclassified Bartonella]UXM96493.1 DegT/DnrJ/EryC1/StrS family aminotransferase [Bartonella sp. HY329]UXN10816.1 DegT/DnrJ/EryC1/StrS family aminotransferase [Bartonella sp. HY328]
MPRVFTSKKMHGELPPTAGLPLRLTDFFGKSGDIAEIIAKHFHLPPLLLECSGTASLIVALETLKRLNSKDDLASTRNEVIIPAFNCPLVVLAIHHCGLKPIICDTAQNSFDFCFEQLQQLAHHKTLAIIPTHIGGRLANVEASLAIARNIGAYIIEDGAQALGAEIGQSGDVAFFSLAVGKGLTLFEGGLLTAKDPNLFHQLQLTHKNLVKPNFFADKIKLAQLMGYYCCYNPLLLEFFYGHSRRKALKKHDYINAVGDYFDQEIPIFDVGKKRRQIGANAALRLPDFLQKTKMQAVKRIEILENNPILQQSGLSIVKGESATKGTWPFIMLLMPNVDSCQRAMERLWPSNLGVTRLFVSSLPDYNYLQPVLSDDNRTHKSANAVDFAQRMITITNCLWLDDESFNIIIQELEKALTLKSNSNQILKI